MKKYENVENRGSCSFRSVAIALLIIFVLLLCAILYLKYKVILPVKNNKSTIENLDQSIEKQLDGQSGEKVVSITITESDLSNALSTSAKDFPLKNPSIKIDRDRIVLSGKTSNSPLAFKLEVGIIPRVLNDRVVFDIKDIKTGGVNAPKVVTDAVNKNLSTYLNQVNLNEGIKLTDVKLYQGYLVATGERK